MFTGLCTSTVCFILIVLFCFVLSCLVLSCPVLSCLQSCLVLYCFVLSCLLYLFSTRFSSSLFSNNQAAHNNKFTVTGHAHLFRVQQQMSIGPHATRPPAKDQHIRGHSTITHSPIIPSAPKCSSRHFIFHRKYVCFE